MPLVFYFLFLKKGATIMAEIKDKVVTVESLAVLHEDSKNTYMSKTDPSGNGIMTLDGNADFSGNINVGSISIGSNIKLVPTEDGIEIVFLGEETVNEG